MVKINYSRIIKRELPRLHCVQYPISRKQLIQEFQEKVYKLSPPEWGEYSKNRGDELKRLENTIIFNQLHKNNFLHAWKEIYQDVNDLCNDFKVPNHRRIEFYRKELEYLSLYIHDVLPLNYNEQGIHPNDPSISKYTKFFSKNDSLLEARKKWYDFILQDYNYFWDVYSNKINYRTLTDPEIVKLQDIYDIVYFINPDGIRTLLNTPDTHAIVNYVYQRFIKVKNWVPTRHYSYYVWLIYGWRELPHHFLCYNSGYYNDEMILSRWVPKFLSYDDFKNYDHYIIDQQYQNNPSQTILPRLLSSKKQKSLMMPRNHFETQYDYYDSVRNSTSLISSDPRALFHNQEQKFKVEKYIKVLELTFEQLYESEFEKEEHNLFPSKNIPLDWIIWYDSYNQKFRDALYLYGYKIHTANYLKDASKM